MLLNKKSRFCPTLSLETSKKHRPLFLLYTFIKPKTYATLAAVDTSENVKSTAINIHHITPSNNKNLTCCICKAGHSSTHTPENHGMWWLDWKFRVITMTTFWTFWTTSCSGVKIQNTMSLGRKRGSTVDQYVTVLPEAAARPYKEAIRVSFLSNRWPRSWESIKTAATDSFLRLIYKVKYVSSLLLQNGPQETCSWIQREQNTRRINHFNNCGL